MCEDGFNYPVEIEPASAQPDSVPDQSEATTWRIVRYTFDDSEDGGANDFRPSNSKTVIIEELFDQIRRKQAEAFGSNFTSLKANFEISGWLEELKKHIPHGSFEDVVKARVGIGRAWCARLRQLGRRWNEIQQALQWARDTGRLERSEVSVDHALALLRAWLKDTANGGDNNSASQAENGSVKAKKPSKKELLEKRVDDLDRQLQQALQLIAFLKSENERLRKELYPDVLIADHTVVALPAAEDAGN